jgi:hypothetical protein
MSKERKAQILELHACGKTYAEIRAEIKCSWSFYYTTINNKKYAKPATGEEVRGLSVDERKALRCIAKNRDRSVNRLLLTYIRNGIGGEPPQNKIYED